MSTESIHLPWRVNSVTGGHISDANGNPVCFCVGRNCAERAQFIVDAVNRIEHARGIAKTTVGEYVELATDYNKMRDLVRRMADQLDGLVRFCLGSIPYSELSPMEGTEKLQPLIQLVHEARKAVGGVK